VVLSDFQRANGASVALALLSKIPSVLDRTTASVALIDAAIQLLLATRWKNVKPPKFHEAPDYVMWRFKHVSYVFVPVIDDETFDAYESVRRRGATIFMIVPPNHDMLVRDAFEMRYGEAKFYVSALEDHMSWRVMWASLDEDWSYEKTIHWWLQRYNSFLSTRNAPTSLQIDLSATSPVS
jgi:hypothetical protein